MDEIIKYCRSIGIKVEVDNNPSQERINEKLIKIENKKKLLK